MSSSIYWVPVIPTDKHPLPFELKKMLGPRYCNHDGSLISEPIEFTSTDVPYLTGLADCNTPGAQELIDAIYKYKSVMVCWEG
jgi:hypothetical protein